MDVSVDSSPHPQYLDKEYETKESFLAACIKHNVSVGKECKVTRPDTTRVRVTGSDDSCNVRMMGDTFPSHFLSFSPSHFYLSLTVLHLVPLQQKVKKVACNFA
jgi:hypothetical protein